MSCHLVQCSQNVENKERCITINFTEVASKGEKNGKNMWDEVKDENRDERLAVGD